MKSGTITGNVTPGSNTGGGVSVTEGGIAIIDSKAIIRDNGNGENDFDISFATSNAERLVERFNSSPPESRTLIVLSNSQRIDLDRTITISEQQNITIQPNLTNANRVIRQTGEGRHFVIQGSGTTVTLGAGVTLDGNSEAGGIDLTNNAIFNMTGGIITKNRADNGGGVRVANFGTVHMTGGMISENEAIEGAGVRIDATGGFTMEKGEIIDNHATDLGGGVHVTGAESHFRMMDGTISKNTAVNGGGVRVGTSGTVTMEKGEIIDNHATSTAGIGGGVSVSGAESHFEMIDGTISENTASNAGGVRIESAGSFTMKKGEIINNQAAFGGGVQMTSPESHFRMMDGTISENTADNGGGVRVASGTFTMEAGTITANQASGFNGQGIHVAAPANNQAIEDVQIKIGDAATISGHGDGETDFDIAFNVNHGNQLLKNC